jgi:hypothetical protein
MRKLALVLFLTFSSAAYADNDVVWRGSVPSGRILSGPQMVPSSDCYPTIRRLHGELYYHPMECREKASNYVDIGVPLSRPVNRGPKSATRVYRRKDGWIILK